MPDEEIRNLWVNNRQDRGPYVPKFYGHIQPCHFLSVGLNPSLPAQLPAFLAPLLQPAQLEYPNCFLWENAGLDNAFDLNLANQFANFDRAAIAGYDGFFRRPVQVAQAFNENIQTHADLFFIRSARLPNAYRQACNHRYNAEPNFIQSQLHLSLEIIRAHQPSLVLFVYAGAADIFRRYWNSQNAAHERISFEPIGNTHVKTCFINLNNGAPMTRCIRWPALPQGCRGALPELEFDNTLEIVVQQLLPGH